MEGIPENPTYDFSVFQLDEGVSPALPSRNSSSSSLSEEVDDVAGGFDIETLSRIIQGSDDSDSDEGDGDGESSIASNDSVFERLRLEDEEKEEQLIRNAEEARRKEGFICPECQYKCLSPEALHTHYQVEHNNYSDNYAPDRQEVKVNNPFRGGPNKSNGLVMDPIYAPTQQRQLEVLSGFAYFWIALGTKRWNMPEVLKAIIFSYARHDDYYNYLNFRTPEDYTKGIWPAMFGAKLRADQHKYQFEVIYRSVCNIGVHPKTPFSSELVDLGQAKEVDNLAKKIFKLMGRWAEEYEWVDAYSRECKTKVDCVMEVCKMLKKMPKLTNEAYAQAFKQLKDHPLRSAKRADGILDPKKKRKKNEKANDASSGEGDPGFWFPEILSNHLPTPIYAMPKRSPLKYFQFLYILCQQFLPSPDFLPFVRQRLRGYTTEEGQHNGLTCGEPTHRPKNWHEQGLTGDDLRYDRPPGAGTIEMYAKCCLDSLAKLEKKTRKGKTVESVDKKHVEAMLHRPPLIKGVRVPGGGREIVVHTPPWEPNSAAKGRVCKSLGLTGWESEGMALYLTLGPEQFANIRMGYDLRPFPVPPNFFLGDLSLTDHVDDFVLSLHRKLYFGVPYIRIPPIPRIGLKPGRAYWQGLETREMSKVGVGMLYVQWVEHWRTGEIMYGHDMPHKPFHRHIASTWWHCFNPDRRANRSRGLKINDAKFFNVVIGCSKESRIHFYNDKYHDPEYDYEQEIKDADLALPDEKYVRACLVNVRIAVAIVLRRLIPTPPVPGMKWDWKELELWGNKALVQMVYEQLHQNWIGLGEKRWWEYEIEACLAPLRKMLKEGAIGEVELHDLVLYTMGADPVAGSHFFCMLKEDGMKADPPVPVVNSLFEMKDEEPFWVLVNAVGMHLLSFDEYNRLETIPYNSIIRWSGNLKNLTLTINGEDDDRDTVVTGKAFRATNFRQIMLEIIHSLMTHQGTGMQGDEECESCLERAYGRGGG
ncbi:hypothetical protein TrVE_jg1482 [Triparma verrucosa]|uniref:C2H2-type domain-containing protein n=1 Tax=Triparma verrucosa TaxID=1606542 RepID=A0A9W7B693_9STRA|nr:hypothetical protein TrVE_jg1482 [Triparma verrucosa]